MKTYKESIHIKLYVLIRLIINLQEQEKIGDGDDIKNK